jgi:hypothetical protein
VRERDGGTHGLGDALGVPLDGVLAEELAAVDARQLQPPYEATNKRSLVSNGTASGRERERVWKGRAPLTL